MRLFLKEHTFLIVVQVVQMLVSLTIFWLDGYRDIKLFFYSAFLSFFILAAYLIYYYISRKKFYQRLSDSFESLDDSFQEPDQAPVSLALNRLLKSQYKLYQNQLTTIEKEQEEHRKFMDQWVHQMKTPLSVIELNAQDLDEPDSSNIREETERIKRGLNTVLYMARFKTIEQDLHIKPVRLLKVIQAVNQENKRFYIRNQVYPKVEIARDEVTVETDEKWLFFVLSQLINNAVKYSAGKSNSIVISILEKENDAVLEVKDFGIGIPETDKRRIFDPFYTGENGRKYRESTGMGLYLTKETLDYLGHRLEMESKEGIGTAFRVIFSDTQHLTAL